MKKNQGFTLIELILSL
ncbi:prepilin-type N-terminal cleavage/methylation domain-containing protein, partial [Acinetobacter baumannii]